MTFWDEAGEGLLEFVPLAATVVDDESLMQFDHATCQRFAVFCRPQWPGELPPTIPSVAAPPEAGLPVTVVKQLAPGVRVRRFASVLFEGTLQ